MKPGSRGTRREGAERIDGEERRAGTEVRSCSALMRGVAERKTQSRGEKAEIVDAKALRGKACWLGWSLKAQVDKRRSCSEPHGRMERRRVPCSMLDDPRGGRGRVYLGVCVVNIQCVIRCLNYRG